MDSLQTLDLSANQLSQLESLSFPELSHLQELILSDNLLTILPSDTFVGLRNLQWLDLSNNRLHGITQHLFDDVPNLQSLDLSHNNLSAVSFLTNPDFRLFRKKQINNECMTKNLLDITVNLEVYCRNNHSLPKKRLYLVLLICQLSSEIILYPFTVIYVQHSFFR